MTAVRNLDPDAPATPQVLKAANTLELIALCVEGGMVDPAVIKRTFGDVYLSIYRQITEIRGLPKMTNARSTLWQPRSRVSPRRSVSFTIADPDSDNAYEVTIAETVRSPCETGVLYRKAGPAGKACTCCKGSGVED